MNTSDIHELMEPNEKALLFAASTLAITRFPLKTLAERAKGTIVSKDFFHHKKDVDYEIQLNIEELVRKNIFETCIIDTQTRYSITSVGYNVCAFIREQAAKQTNKINPKIRAIS